jgi:hypothetical protein
VSVSGGAQGEAAAVDCRNTAGAEQAAEWSGRTRDEEVVVVAWRRGVWQGRRSGDLIISS